MSHWRSFSMCSMAEHWDWMPYVHGTRATVKRLRLHMLCICAGMTLLGLCVSFMHGCNNGTCLTPRLKVMPSWGLTLLVIRPGYAGARLIALQIFMDKPLFYKWTPIVQIHSPDDDVTETRETMTFVPSPECWIVPRHIWLSRVQSHEMDLHVLLEHWDSYFLYTPCTLSLSWKEMLENVLHVIPVHIHQR